MYDCMYSVVDLFQLLKPFLQEVSQAYNTCAKYYKAVFTERNPAVFVGRGPSCERALSDFIQTEETH